MTIVNLNKRIGDLVKRFNREHHGNKVARLCETDNSLTIQYVDMNQLRREWVAKWVDLYCHDGNATCPMMNPNTRQVIVAKAELKGKRYRASMGEARCSPYDEFEEDVGLAIAYARACGESIPDYI